MWTSNNFQKIIFKGRDMKALINLLSGEREHGGWEGEFWLLGIGARVAQWIRRRSPKPKIGGSSPPVGNNVFASKFPLGGQLASVAQ